MTRKLYEYLCLKKLIKHTMFSYMLLVTTREFLLLQENIFISIFKLLMKIVTIETIDIEL